LKNNLEFCENREASGILDIKGKLNGLTICKHNLDIAHININNNGTWLKKRKKIKKRWREYFIWKRKRKKVGKGKGRNEEEGGKKE
jgi:hypothetical protein